MNKLPVVILCVATGIFGAVLGAAGSHLYTQLGEEIGEEIGERIHVLVEGMRVDLQVRTKLEALTLLRAGDSKRAAQVLRFSLDDDLVLASRLATRGHVPDASTRDAAARELELRQRAKSGQVDSEPMKALRVLAGQQDAAAQ